MRTVVAEVAIVFIPSGFWLEAAPDVATGGFAAADVAAVGVASAGVEAGGVEAGGADAVGAEVDGGADREVDVGAPGASGVGTS